MDANQGDIVAAFMRYGATVTSAANLGDGFPDLVVGYRGVNYLVEVKDPDKRPSKRALTPNQVTFFDTWRGQVAVVETDDDVKKVLGISA